MAVTGSVRMMRMTSAGKRMEPETVTNAKIAAATLAGWTDAAKAFASGMTAFGAAMIAIALSLIARREQGEDGVTEPGRLLEPAFWLLLMALVAWLVAAACSVLLAGKQRALIRAQAGIATSDDLSHAAIEMIAQAHVEAKLQESRTDHGRLGDESSQGRVNG